MSLYNRIVKYFDVTPGSQITWVTCNGIINRYKKERGQAGVNYVIDLLTRFTEEKNQDINLVSEEDRAALLDLFRYAPGDFKNLLLGGYGRMPMGWPDDWVYESTFGDEWEEKIKSRKEASPLETLKPDNMDRLRKEFADILGRPPLEEEFILYLMHPKDAVSLIEFREKYGDAPLVLPTDVWHDGLKNPGDYVEFEYAGKPCAIELVSVGKEFEGVIHVVMKVDNKTRVYEVNTPRAKKAEIKMASGPCEVGAPINGNLWRLGNPDRGAVKVGDIVHKGEEIANLEAMKMENIIAAPFDGQIKEISVKLNEPVQEGQLLFILEEKE